MEIEDIKKSIKATLYERTGNPFFVSFFLAWCLHNYRIIMIAVSDESLNSKFVKIDSYFDANFLIEGIVVNYGCILHTLLIPLFYSLFYIYIFPFFSIRINEYYFRKQKDLLAAKQAAEDLELLTKEQSRELKQKFIILENEYSNKLEKLEQENSEFRLIINRPSEAPSSETSKPEEVIFELDADELKVLVAFSGYDRRSANEVSESIRMNLEKVKFICTDLMHKNLLSVHSSNSQGQYLFALEQLGRKYLHNKNLL